MGENEVTSSALDESARFLAYLLSTCQVAPDGTVVETRKRVAEINGVLIQVRSNEHPPPHFHVRCGGKEASFTIETCALLAGELGRREKKIVEYWRKSRGKNDLIQAWNEMRPGDCSVGRYQ